MKITCQNLMRTVHNSQQYWSAVHMLYLHTECSFKLYVRVYIVMVDIRFVCNHITGMQSCSMVHRACSCGYHDKEHLTYIQCNLARDAGRDLGSCLIHEHSTGTIMMDVK